MKTERLPSGLCLLLAAALAADHRRSRLIGVDVVVVGAGYAGLEVARRLVRGHVCACHWALGRVGACPDSSIGSNTVGSNGVHRIALAAAVRI